MKAIQTKYDGYHFRSRLEARWAVFFNAYGVKYEYEHEGYVLDSGRWYLPDFYFPNGFCGFDHAEVKPEITNINFNKSYEKLEEDIDKFYEFALSMKALLLDGKPRNTLYYSPELLDGEYIWMDNAISCGDSNYIDSTESCYVNSGWSRGDDNLDADCFGRKYISACRKATEARF